MACKKIKDFAKNTKNSSHRNLIRDLNAQLIKNAEFITEKRKNVSPYV